MNNAARNPAKPKKALKDGKVYGDILSAEEKKQLVAQKKKHKKGKKVPKSAQQTIPYVETVSYTHLIRAIRYSL